MVLGKRRSYRLKKASGDVSAFDASHAVAWDGDGGSKKVVEAMRIGKAGVRRAAQDLSGWEPADSAPGSGVENYENGDMAVSTEDSGDEFHGGYSWTATVGGEAVADGWAESEPEAMMDGIGACADAADAMQDDAMPADDVTPERFASRRRTLAYLVSGGRR